MIDSTAYGKSPAAKNLARNLEEDGRKFLAKHAGRTLTVWSKYLSDASMNPRSPRMMLELVRGAFVQSFAKDQLIPDAIKRACLSILVGKYRTLLKKAPQK